MARRTINTNMLTAGKTFMIRGKLTFSRVATQVTGEELVRDMQKRQQRRMNPIDKPYTTASICEAQIIYHDGTNKTNEEIYAEESMYQSTSANATGWCFSGYNKGKSLPWIGIGRGDGRGGITVDQIAPEEIQGELASGLDVTLVMRVFAATPNQGVSMDGIIVNEPIRYYNRNSGVGLADYGITFNPAPGGTAPAATADAAPAAGTPVSAPSGNPYSYSGAPEAPAAAPSGYGYPASQPTPAAAAPAPQAAPGTYGAPAPGTYGSTAPAPQAAPGTYGAPASAPQAAPGTYGAPAPGTYGSAASAPQATPGTYGAPAPVTADNAPFQATSPAAAAPENDPNKGIRYDPKDRQY